VQCICQRREEPGYYITKWAAHRKNFALWRQEVTQLYALEAALATIFQTKTKLAKTAPEIKALLGVLKQLEKIQDQLIKHNLPKNSKKVEDEQDLLDGIDSRKTVGAFITFSDDEDVSCVLNWFHKGSQEKAKRMLAHGEECEAGFRETGPEVLLGLASLLYRTPHFLHTLE
jgi:hypothetical protein